MRFPLLLGKMHLLTRSRPSGTPSGTAAKTTDEPAARPRHRGRRKRRGRARPTRKKSPLGAPGAFVRTAQPRTRARTHKPAERGKDTQRVRARETRENGRDADTHSHRAAAAQKRSPRRHTAPLRLQASAPGVKTPRGREQPTDTRADLSWRSRGQDFWGDSPQRRPGRPEAGTTRRFPRTPPAVWSSWPARCDSRRPSGDVPVDPVER